MSGSNLPSDYHYPESPDIIEEMLYNLAYRSLKSFIVWLENQEDMDRDPTLGDRISKYCEQIRHEVVCDVRFSSSKAFTNFCNWLQHPHVWSEPGVFNTNNAYTGMPFDGIALAGGQLWVPTYPVLIEVFNQAYKHLQPVQTRAGNQDNSQLYAECDDSIRKLNKILADLGTQTHSISCCNEDGRRYIKTLLETLRPAEGDSL